MKYHLPIIFLAIIFSASTSVAGMKMRGDFARVKPNGEVARVKFYGSIIQSPDRVMSKALTRAKGQAIYNNPAGRNELRTTSPISVVSSTSIGLDMGDEVKTFRITPDTVFCDYNRKKIGLNIFRAGEIATVSSGFDESVASTIRRGPMYFIGVMAGTPELVDVGCFK